MEVAKVTLADAFHRGVTALECPRRAPSHLCTSAGLRMAITGWASPLGCVTIEWSVWSFFTWVVALQRISGDSHSPFLQMLLVEVAHRAIPCEDVTSSRGEEIYPTDLWKEPCACVGISQMLLPSFFADCSPPKLTFDWPLLMPISLQLNQKMGFAMYQLCDVEHVAYNRTLHILPQKLDEIMKHLTQHLTWINMQQILVYLTLFFRDHFLQSKYI